MSRIIWNAERYLNKANAVAEKVNAESAKRVLDDARRILTNKAKYPTGHLAREIEIITMKPKGRGGIYHETLVWAQPPGGWTKPYHAIFVELGTPNKKGKRRGSTEAMPYLRPAHHKNKRGHLKRMQAAFK